MHIRKITISSVRAIDHFEMTFPEDAAGWHVLIGDNGAGKSTIVRAIALGLIGPYNAKALRLNFNDWLHRGGGAGQISLEIQRHKEDLREGPGATRQRPFTATLHIGQEAHPAPATLKSNPRDPIPLSHLWGHGHGWFSAGFGPFRRLTGGDNELFRIYLSEPRAGAHLSIFGESVALTEAIRWLQELQYKRLEQHPKEAHLLDHCTAFLNESGLLPHGTKLKQITSEGVLFEDGNGVIVDVTQMSDGYRSVLSLTFELLRQLVSVYGTAKVFAGFKRRKTITVPGVVLIDEVDAHLHPTWQTRIGEWFTRVFPRIQFIVTTHSPLICRAAEKGSIWRLPAPGSGQKPEEVTGAARKRLILGTVLDAYGTELFGYNVARSQEATNQLNELAQLSAKKSFGRLEEAEAAKLTELRQVFTTDDPTEY